MAATVVSDDGGRRWEIATTVGFAVEGYLPEWAEENPSLSEVPLDLLPVRLTDVNHWAEFAGQPMSLHPAVGEDDGVGQGDEQVFWGSIECRPFAEEPESRVPVVNLAVVGDSWINGLDPDGLAEVAAKLRAQADRLENEVRPRLIAARVDWAEHQGARMSTAVSTSRVADRPDRGASQDRPRPDHS